MPIMLGCAVLNSQMHQGRLIQFLEGRKTGEDVSSSIITLLGICLLCTVSQCTGEYSRAGCMVEPQVNAECLGWAAQAVLFSIVNSFERSFEFKWLFLSGFLSGQFRDYMELSLLNPDPTYLLPPRCDVYSPLLPFLQVLGSAEGSQLARSFLLYLLLCLAALATLVSRTQLIPEHNCSGEHHRVLYSAA